MFKLFNSRPDAVAGGSEIEKPTFKELKNYFEKDNISNIEKLFNECPKNEKEARKSEAFPYLKNFIISHVENPIEMDISLLTKIVLSNIWTLNEIPANEDINKAITNSLIQLKNENDNNSVFEIEDLFGLIKEEKDKK